MATLLGQKINATYDSLLKTEDNDGITGSLKQLTDGVGQTTPLYLSTTEAKIGGNLEITGDLTVGGTTTYVNTDNVTVKDGLVLLANDNVADIIDIGLYGKYNDGSVKYTGLYRDATDGVFKIFDGLTTEPTTTVGGGDLADFAAAGGSFSGNLTLTTGKIFVNGAGNNGYINSKGAVAAQVASIDNSRLFRGLDSSVQEVFYVQGTGDVYASGNATFLGSVTANSFSGDGSSITSVNAATLDSLDSTQFLRSDESDTMNGGLTIESTTDARLSIKDTGGGASFLIIEAASTSNANIYLGDSADSNAGAIVYNNSDNSMSFRTNGFLERMVIDGSGNVGIGLVPYSSAQLLNLKGSGLALKNDKNGDNNNWSYISNESTGSQSTLNFSTGGVINAMNIDHSGNVGIGISPSAKLDVLGDMRVGDGNRTNFNGNTKIQISEGAAPSYIQFISNNTEQQAILFGDGDDSVVGSVRYDHSVDDMYFETNNAERMRIDSSGRVGIGGSPDAKIKVFGDSAYTVTSAGRAAQGIHISATAGGSGLYGGAISFSTGGSGSSAIAAVQGSADSDANGLAFFTHGSGTGSADATERMRITSGGSVLVGTQSSSGFPLEVYGGTGDGVKIKAGNSSNDDSLLITDNSDTTLFKVDGGGNVGINCVPSEIFQVDKKSSGVIAHLEGNSSYHMTIGEDSGNMYINANNGNATIEFRTNTTERMRITSGGNIQIFGNPVLSPYEGAIIEDVGNGCRFNIGRSANAILLGFYNQNGIVGNIQTSGSSTSYNTSSDYRLKEDWQPMADALTRIDALKPVNFAWKADGSRVDGFLAHELQEVIPEAVTGTKDAMRDEEYEVSPAVYEEVVHPAEEAVYETIEHPAIAEELDADGNIIVEAQEAYTEEVLVSEAKEEWTEKVLVSEAVMGTRSVPDYQGIDQSKIVPLLVAAIQELKAEVDALKGA